MASEYICEKCGLKFKKKQEYTRHINKLTSCIGGSKTNKKIIMYPCGKCKKKFNRKDSMNRHFKTCKEKVIKIVNNDSSNSNNNSAPNMDNGIINVGNNTIIKGSICNNNNSNNNTTVKNPVSINLILL